MFAAFTFNRGISVGDNGLINLLVTLVVFGVIAYIVWSIIEWMKLPPKGAMIARILCGLIAIVVLLHLVGIY